MIYQIHICPSCHHQLVGTEGIGGGAYWHCEYLDCVARGVDITDGGLVIEVTRVVPGPARLLQGTWYVPVADLQEALDALERLHTNAKLIFKRQPVRDWAETLAESESLLKRSGRLDA